VAVGAEHRVESGSEPATDWAFGDSEANADRELRPHRVLEANAEWKNGYERDENVARSLRTRSMLVWGGLAYLSFLITDVGVQAMRESGLATTFVIARLVGAIPLVLLWLRLRRGPTPTRSTLMAFEMIGTSSVAAVTAFMALLTGSIASPILAGLLPILVIRAVGFPDPWRRGLLLVGAPAMVFWTVVSVGSLMFPHLVDGGLDGRINLIIQIAIQLLTLGLVVAGSHVGWQLRRNLYMARHVGRYELRRLLGRGAMGEVWAAWHQGLRQEVALKILPVERADAAAIERFEREVVATTKLRHPNTVRVYDFGFTREGFWYYAMELLEGETVAELVAREGPLPIGRALGLVQQAARALREAHERGVVHRDVKPENLIVWAPVGERDFVKVLDFGVATITAEAVQHDQGPTEPLGVAGKVREAATEPGDGSEPPVEPERAVGTPLYISPEAACGRPTDARSDIYALGGVLYFMLTARPPFIERNAPALLRAHVERRPTSPSALLSTPLPEYVEKLVLRCLAKHPDDRYPDADALIRAIDLCVRLDDNDRRRGETQQPRLRMTPDQIEALAEQSRTDTDMTLIKE
jgi:serine/threonine protein kinase